MTVVIAFFGGLFFGGSIGVLIGGIMSSAKRADEEMEILFRRDRFDDDGVN